MNYGMGGLISAHVDSYSYSFGEQSDDVTSEHLKVLFSKIKRFQNISVKCWGPITVVGLLLAKLIALKGLNMLFIGATGHGMGLSKKQQNCDLSKLQCGKKCLMHSKLFWKSCRLIGT